MMQGAADRDLLDLVERFFHDHAGTTVDGGGQLAAAWPELAATGLPWVGIDEDRGGSGGSVVDAVAVVAGAARHAVDVPLVETWLSAWLLSRTGQPVEADPATVAMGELDLSVDGDHVTGRLSDVPWLPRVATVLVLEDDGVDTRLVSLGLDGLEPTEGEDLAGQPRGSVELDSHPVSTWSSRATHAELSQRATLLRAAQLAGAMSGIHDLTWRYANERVQFGRPIAAFQAVQQHLVTIAQCATMSISAVEQAALALDRGPASFEIAAAKLVASTCAPDCSRAAHQAHGAIGMTREYPLQRLTRRLHQWREEDGGRRRLAAAIGSGVASHPSLAALVASAQPELEVVW